MPVWIKSPSSFSPGLIGRIVEATEPGNLTKWLDYKALPTRREASGQRELARGYVRSVKTFGYDPNCEKLGRFVLSTRVREDEFGKFVVQVQARIRLDPAVEAGADLILEALNHGV